MVAPQDIRDALVGRGVREEELVRVPDADFEAIAKAVNAAVPDDADAEVWGDALMDESVIGALPQGVEAITKSIEALLKASKPDEPDGADTGDEADEEDDDKAKAAKLAAAKFGKGKKKCTGKAGCKCEKCKPDDDEDDVDPDDKCPDCGGNLDSDGKCPDCDDDDLGDEKPMGKSLSEVLEAQIAEATQYDDDGEPFVDMGDLVKGLVTSFETFTAERDGAILGALQELSKQQQELSKSLAPIAKAVREQDELRKSLDEQRKQKGTPTMPAGRPVGQYEVAARGSQFGSVPDDEGELLTKALGSGMISLVEKGTIEKDIREGSGAVHQTLLDGLRKSLGA